jgi:hypothetical protein
VEIVKQFATEDKFLFDLKEKLNKTTTLILLRLFYVGIFQFKRMAEQREVNPFNAGIFLLKGSATAGS